MNEVEPVYAAGEVDEVIADLDEQARETVMAPAARTPASRRWVRWALAIAATIAAVIVWELWRAHAQSEIRYETSVVQLGTVQESVTATGTLDPVVDVLVGSQVSGNIKALEADFNTKVTKGQLVAQIDPQVFQTQVDQAQAARNSAQSAVLTSVAQVQKSQSDLTGTVASEKAVEALLAKDKATALNAANEFQRQNTLFADGIISRQDEDAAKAAQDASAAQVVADQAQIGAATQTIVSAQAQVHVAQAQMGSAQAQESQAQAALDQAQVNLAHTQITAPVNGTVIARNMNVGQTVAASLQSPTIFEIAQDLTKMQLDTNVDESDVANIAVGQTATFTVDAYPGEKFSGRVTMVRKTPINTQNVVTYDVVVAVSNPDLKLFPGMTANARILTLKVSHTLKVENAVLRLHPSPAILAQAGLPPVRRGQPVIYILRGGKPVALPATFGISDGKFTAVTSAGLRAGDQAVVGFTTAAAAPASSPARPAGRGPSF